MNDPKLIISLLAFVLALISFCCSLWLGRQNNIISRRPILSIEYNEKSGWHVRNIGNGPALNILVAQKIVESKWFNPVRIPPIAQGDSLHLTWLEHVNSTGIGSTYEDFSGKLYTSTCENDLVCLFIGDHLGSFKESEIGRNWNQDVSEIKKKL